MLAAAPLHEQKQMIGECLVPLAESWLAWWETANIGTQTTGTQT